MVLALDLIDRGILFDLRENCRISYKTLAENHNISSNAIKNRIDGLTKSGVLDRYFIQLSRAMVNSEFMFVLLYTDKSIDDDTFSELVFKEPSVVQIHFDSSGTCIVYAECYGAKHMGELSQFFRGIESVEVAEIHTLPSQKGQKIDLSNIQLRVLAPLLDNPRMAISKIAQKTGLTARRVRRTLIELIETGAVEFTISWNLSKADATNFAFRISWDPKVMNPDSIEEKIKGEYPIKIWRVVYSSTESLLWASFLVDHARDVESIAASLRNIPSLVIESTILTYPPKKKRKVRENILRELVSESGYI